MHFQIFQGLELQLWKPIGIQLIHGEKRASRASHPYVDTRVECHHPTQGDFPNQLAMANLWIGGCGTLTTNHRKLYAVLPWFAGALILAELFFLDYI